MREVLGVDIDSVVGRIMANLSVKQAEKSAKYSEEWKRYMRRKGGIVVIPRSVSDVGKKKKKV